MKIYTICISDEKVAEVNGDYIQFNEVTKNYELHEKEDCFSKIVAIIPPTMLIIITDKIDEKM